MSKILFDETAASSYKRKAKQQISANEALAAPKKANDEQAGKARGIEQAPSQDKVEAQAKGPAVLKIVVPQKPETKSKAVNFKIRPSLKAQFTQKCEEIGVSQNNVFEQLIELFVNMDK